MIDHAIAELEPLIGVRAGCAAVGEAQARWYRRHRQSPPPAKPERVPAPQPRALSEVERKELRRVRHDMEKDIDSLGWRLKAVNIALIPFLVVADGYGHVRFPRFVWSGFVNQTVVLTTKMPKNRASSFHGATAAGDGVNIDKLIDDKEATNWAVLNRATGVGGAQVTVKLAGGAQKVAQVNVSALTRPYCPGRSSCCGLGNDALIRIVPVLGSI